MLTNTADVLIPDNIDELPKAGDVIDRYVVYGRKYERHERCDDRNSVGNEQGG